MFSRFKVLILQLYEDYGTRKVVLNGSSYAAVLALRCLEVPIILAILMVTILAIIIIRVLMLVILEAPAVASC